MLTYTYDGLRRLTNAASSDGAQYQYTYDASGNRLTTNEPTGSSSATYDAANQLLTRNGVPVPYDANGNLLDDGSTSYQYDHLDRLVRATRGITTTAIGYTGDGDRLWQATNDVTTTYTLDLNTALAQVLGQQTSTGSATVILPGIGQQADGAWQFGHADALGSLRALTNAGGQVIGTMQYTPFGDVTAATGVLAPFGFTGAAQDAASGLTYLRARFYHPALGRFLSPDSLVPDPLNGQAWNAYAYVYNDPVNLVDRTGFAPEPAGGIGSIVNGLQQLANAAQQRAGAVGTWWNASPCDCDSGSAPMAAVACT